MSSSRQSLTVLVADDDDDDRQFIRKAWDKSRTGAELRFVEDGEELTQYLNHSGRYCSVDSAPRPALVLLDLNMPRKDGREALREIKVNPALRQIPVVVLTTSQAEEDVRRCYQLGANSYITKPKTSGGLVDVLRVLEKYWIEIVDLPSDSIGAWE